MVSLETSLGIPALIWAWREGIWPWPAWRTWPMTTCCTCSGATSARSSAAVMAVAPSSVHRRSKAAAELADGRAGGSEDHGLGHDGLSASERSPGRPMHASATTDAPAVHEADTIAIGVFDDEGIAHDLEGGALKALLESGEARTSFKHLALHHADGRRWLLVGLGARDAFDAERARVAAAAVHVRARELGAAALCWELPHHVPDEVAAALVEGRPRRLPLRPLPRAPRGRAAPSVQE